MPLLTRERPLRVNTTAMLVARIGVHILVSIWAALIFYQAFSGALPGDPVQYLIDFTGIGTLNLLLVSLSISLLSMRLKFAQLMKFRKTFGVYAAIYALLHFSVFIAFELQFEWSLILSEIIERPYITVGFCALLILSALLLTSFDRVKRQLGPLWQRIHNTVYIAVILANIHFIWSIKSTEFLPYLYISLTLLLLYLKRKKWQKIFK